MSLTTMAIFVVFILAGGIAGGVSYNFWGVEAYLLTNILVAVFGAMLGRWRGHCDSPR